MTKEKTGWEQIPSLEGLEVDWKYEPENPLGKRAWLRIVNTELYSILGVQSIAVKVVSKNFEEIGLLIDIAQGGVAVLLKSKLATGQLLKIGFLLGKHKVISRAIVKNLTEIEGKSRTGIEFIELEKELRNYIAGIISSKVFQQPL